MSLEKPTISYKNPVHTDATASPNDVSINKFFYNNDGRQKGTFVKAIGLKALQAFYGGDIKSIVYNANNKGTENVWYMNSITLNGDLKIVNIESFAYSEAIENVIKLKGVLIGFLFKNKTFLATNCYETHFNIDNSIQIVSSSNLIAVKIDTNCLEPITIFYK